MNRLRIRFCSQVREFVLAEAEQHCLECVTLALQRRLRDVYSITQFTLDDLGAFAWDIYLDGRKVGHAKAFHHAEQKHDCSNPTLFQWIILVGMMYLALC
jgi:hypothetical protein